MLSATQLQQVHRLWSDLADFGAARPDEALRFFMGRLCQLVRADDAAWVGSVRMAYGAVAAADLQYGWRVRANLLLRASPERAAVMARAVKNQDTTEVGATTRAVAKNAGKFRAAVTRDLVDFTAFRRTNHYRQLYAPLGINDRLHVSFPVNDEAESHFLFDLSHTRRRFKPSEVELAACAIRGVKTFHMQLMLGHGLAVATSPLTPTQRRVLRLLLTGKPEKTIAAELRQSFHTTHAHVGDLFRAYGVGGRAELMAIWLKRV